MRWAIVGLALLTLIGVAVVASILTLNGFLHAPANIPEQGVSFEIPAGATFRAVSDELAERDVIDQPDWLRWYARFSGQASDIRAGQYRLEAGETAADLLDKFVRGEEELFTFTIIEGWNYRELIAALKASDVLEFTIDAEDWAGVLESIGATEAHPEGIFLPETYSFPKNSTDIDLLRQAYQHMQEALAAEWQGRDTGLPLQTPYEALTLASIIEKETARADERPLIGGVFVRRLHKGMRLQTDPTVIYGIGPTFNGNIRRSDLKTDTPYNTYTRGGLPPTPIAMPGRAAINAAVHPAAGNELFFVATGLGDGSHKFSVNKEEHDAAVKEYLVRLRANKSK